MRYPIQSAAPSVERFLQRLGERAGRAELIEVDRGSSDGTLDLSRNHCARCLHALPSRALQMNVGARAASGDTSWFVHADSEVPVDCLEQISEALPILR